MKQENKTITTYKGFDKDLKCRDFQYEVGKEYELPKGETVEICRRGFHACKSPLEVLDYYFMDGHANLSRFCEVEQSGEFSKKDNSTKVASSKIKIKKEITFTDLIEFGVEWLKKNTSNDSGNYSLIASSGYSTQIGSSRYSVKIASSGYCEQIASSGNYAHIASSGNYAQIASSGNYAQIASSGDSTQIGSSGNYAQIGSSGNYAQIASSGYSAQIGSSGDYAQINSTGEDSVIMCAGHDSAVKAKRGSWITLTEWYIDEETKQMKPKYVKTEYVDGERIKEDTWYRLFNGKFVEVNS